MRLPPRSFAGQLALLLFLALLVAQVVGFLLFVGERVRMARQVYQDTVVERTITLIRLIQDMPPALHERMLEAVSTPFVKFWSSNLPQTAGGGDSVSTFLSDELADSLATPHRNVRVSVGLEDPKLRPAWWWPPVLGGPPPPPPKIGWFKASIAISQGNWLNIATGPPPDPRPFGGPLFISLVLSTIATLLAALVVARRIVQPMRKLAEAAERFGRGEPVEPLPETGPNEARRSARAFNDMRERLDRFVRDRTRTLAAISHDLRTPITSLRLRAELVEDEETRDKLIETIEEMQRLTEATLAFVRADQAEEETRPIDLAALVDSLAEDLAELNQEVTVTEQARPVVRGRTVALRRALRNIIENAVRYGERARVTVGCDAVEAKVVVEDDGPGLPDGEMERLFEPFVRGEASRSRETGGIGLGLAIARSIFQSHGGDIRLENVPKVGLRVVMTLPL